jgi:hypothetical protein
LFLREWAPPFLNSGLRAIRLRGFTGILRLDFILSWPREDPGWGAIDGARKNSGGQNNRLVEKKAGLQETSLVFHL